MTALPRSLNRTTVLLALALAAIVLLGTMTPSGNTQLAEDVTVLSYRAFDKIGLDIEMKTV